MAEALRGDDVVGVLAARVHGLRHGRDLPVVVCLDGRSGSGKTTLARRLTRALRDDGAGVSVLHLDHVYPGWDGLAAASRLLAHGLLPPLRLGRAASYPSWSWVRDRPGPVVTVRPDDVVLVEGVGSGPRAARAHTDLLVWLEAPTAVRHARAMARDGETYAPHWARWAAQEEAYLAGEGPDAAADLRVATAGPTGGPTGGQADGAAPTGGPADGAAVPAPGAAWPGVPPRP